MPVLKLLGFNYRGNWEGRRWVVSVFELLGFNYRGNWEGRRGLCCIALELQSNLSYPDSFVLRVQYCV